MDGGPPPGRRRHAPQGKALSPLGRRNVVHGKAAVPPLGRRALSQVVLAAQEAQGKARDGSVSLEANPAGAKEGADPVIAHLRKAKVGPPNQQVISDVVTKVLELSEELRVVRRQIGSQDETADFKRRIEKLEEAQEDCNSAWTVLQEKGCPRCCLNGSLNRSLNLQDAPDHDEGPLVESGSREVQLALNLSEPAVAYCQQEVDRVKTLLQQLQTQWQASEQRWQEAAADDRFARAELDAALATLKAHASEDRAELGNLGDEAARADGERQELRSLLTSLQEGQVEVIRHLQGALDVQENHRMQLTQQQRALESASQERVAIRTIVERVEASQSLVTGKLAYLIHTS